MAHYGDMSENHTPHDQKTAKPAKTQKVVGAALKYEAFCRTYHGNRKNGTQAAIAAGYAPNSAAVTASKLLKRPNILARLQELEDEALRKYDITADRVREEMAAIAFSNIAEFVTLEPVNPNKPDGRKHAFIDIAAVMERNPVLLRALAGLEIIDMPPMEIAVGGQEMGREVLKTKIKMYDKVAILIKLGEMTKAIEPPPAAPGADVTVKFDDRALAERIAFMLANPKVQNGKKAPQR